VSDSTLLHDRNDKGRIYARANVAVYWIVNLVDMRVEVYTDPSGPCPAPGYRQRQDYNLTDVIPLSTGGQARPPVPVAAILG
jgi:hypothetical protein